VNLPHRLVGFCGIAFKRSATTTLGAGKPEVATLFPKLKDNGGRRLDIDRRAFVYAMHIPERRTEHDRRSGIERRKGEAKASEKKGAEKLFANFKRPQRFGRRRSDLGVLCYSGVGHLPHRLAIWYFYDTLCHLKLLHSSRGVSKGEFLIHS
jgi:hypothetical protein